MKKLIPIALVFITTATLTVGSSSIFAQDKSVTTSTTTVSGSANSATNEKNFQEHKTKILKHIGDRLTKMQKIQSCVEAANDAQALKACKPHKDKKHDDK